MRSTGRLRRRDAENEADEMMRDLLDAGCDEDVAQDAVKYMLRDFDFHVVGRPRVRKPSGEIA